MREGEAVEEQSAAGAPQEDASPRETYPPDPFEIGAYWNEVLPTIFYARPPW